MSNYIGYNGTFPFDKPGDPYGDHNYIGMRIVCTAMGAALVPLRYCYNAINTALFIRIIVVYILLPDTC